MSKEGKSKRRLIVLVKWRFQPDKSGPSGLSKYWWSDGSKSESACTSYLEAVAQLQAIQDGGGEKQL